MTNILKKKIWFEWSVQTSSTYGSKIDSECFSFQGGKYAFRFRTGYPSCNFLHFLSYARNNEKFDVTVVVDWYRKTEILEKKSFEGFELCWENLDFDMRGSKLTFKVIIEGDISREDKCAQTASYLNTEVSVESFTKDISQLLDAGQNYDAEIKSGDHSVKAYKILLCARSNVFKAMLKSDMAEGRTGIVEMKDIDIDYVKDFVKYLYTGTIPELSLDKAVVLYEIGDKYGIRSLMLRCREYLQDILSPENVFQCFVLADAHSDQELKDSIKTYVLNEKIYLEDEYWSPFCDRYPKIAIEIYKLSHKNVNKSEDH